MNLHWAPTSEEIAAADAEPWSGPFATWLREIEYWPLVRAGLAGGLLYVLGGSAALAGYLGFNEHLTWPPGVLIVGLLAFVGGALMFAAVILVEPKELKRFGPVGIGLMLALGGVLTSAGVLASGPDLNYIAIIYVEAPIFAVYLLKRWPAVLITVLAAVEYLVCVLVEPGAAPPWTQWYTVSSTVVGTALLVGGMARRGDEARSAEKRVRGELAEMNSDLSVRVSEQVEELARLNDLRRFLSPQIAEVVEGQTEHLLQPHRRRIAVLFGDLRGFTAFTNAREPEEVLEVLNAYYAEVGAAIQEHGATIGGYEGDGFMAYLGDPLPVTDPAKHALRMAIDLRSRVMSLEQNWKRRGFDLGFGIGVAYGYATLGVVGTAGRLDYTPLGSVVNLAARLCASATSGQILVDQATFAAGGEEVPVTLHLNLDLKGFGSVPTYTVA